ncbi:MAG: ABC transporter permease [Eggerthellaceae bacterium]|jgi:ABC-2 type transport system permease protein|nr:ABC transporter permease [Eggerthellaceae bacterium]MDR2716288.1 ABC transporter permease [Coriobacteriaceae bacterium]
MTTTTLSNSRAQRNWFIITSLVTKDFKLKYRRSVLGVFWSVLNPLLMMIVLATVFSYLFERFELENFPLYLILGQTLYSFMSEATQGSMVSIIQSAPLVKKIRIEKMLFPVSKVLFSLLNFTISLIAVTAVMLFFKVVPTFNLLFLPLLLAYVFVFSLGLGLLLSTLSVFFRDVVHIWSVVTMAWMYATPIIYPVELLRPWMMDAMQFNPMYHYVTYFREIVLWGTTPGLAENLLCLMFALVTFAVGMLVFRRNEKRFILYV